MTSGDPLAGPPHLLLTLDHQETGTLLGVLAWVIGGLEMMRDRAEAVDEPTFVELHASIVPRLEALLAMMNEARQRSPFEDVDQLEPDVEAAYSQVRQAFEAWIELTAYDTATAAVATHDDEAGTESDS
jgi:hypothetical protein